MPPDLDVLRKVAQWLTYGDEDMRLARYGLTMATGCPYRLIAYHAQQCAEKHLKAYLVFREHDFPYTHNILRLLELCPREEGWLKTLEDAKGLTPFAITLRYPGAEETVTREEALRAIEVAARVRQVVRDALARAGVHLGEEPTS